jgi:hypothetical protein
VCVCVCVSAGLARNNALRFDTHIRCSKEQAVDPQRRALAFTQCRRATVHLSITMHCAQITDRNVEAAVLAGSGIELLRSLTNYVKTQVSWQVTFAL